jgi:hypothetical protein
MPPYALFKQKNKVGTGDAALQSELHTGLRDIVAIITTIIIKSFPWSFSCMEIAAATLVGSAHFSPNDPLP